MNEYPPQRVQLAEFLLRTSTVRDDVLIAEAVRANLERLAPYMPWATPESGTVEFQRERLLKVAADWSAHTSYQYLAVDENDSLLGIFGLERRIGPGALEIGYWLDAAATGRGIATTAARALTAAALALPGIDRVEIHMDESNGPSRRVPERLGYRLDRLVVEPIKAPAQTGRQLIWIYP